MERTNWSSWENQHLCDHAGIFCGLRAHLTGKLADIHFSLNLSGTSLVKYGWKSSLKFWHQILSISAVAEEREHVTAPLTLRNSFCLLSFSPFTGCFRAYTGHYWSKSLMLPPQRLGWLGGMLTVALSIARKLPCHVRLLGNTLAAGKMQHGSRTLDGLSRRFGVFLLPQVIWRLVAKRLARPK